MQDHRLACKCSPQRSRPSHSQDNQCKITALVLSNAQFNDKAGGKLISALVEGLGKGDHGYEKITSLSLAKNDLGKQFTTALKQLLWCE